MKVGKLINCNEYVMKILDPTAFLSSVAGLSPFFSSVCILMLRCAFQRCFPFVQGVMVRLMLVLAPVMCILSGIAVSAILSIYIKVGLYSNE